MKLEKYLYQVGIKPAEFAARIGVDVSAVTRWMAGTRKPEWKRMPDIVAATGGAVMPNDFLDVPDDDASDEAPPVAAE